VPKGFPAALRAQKIGKRASKAGLDFSSVENAVECLKNGIDDFKTAYKTDDKDDAEKVLGDLLFLAVSAGGKAGCDAEKALKESAERFAKRFTLAEKLALNDGRNVTDLTKKEWEEYYLKAKVLGENDV
jgi:tetrapyrrole methylase family protein/MazG family protein